MADNRVILKAVVGSTAYNIKRPGSDCDEYAIYVIPMDQVLGVYGHAAVGQDASIRRSDPNDYISHEIGKFCRLALLGDPGANEVLWLSRDCEVDEFGARLILAREAFLSQYTMAKYLGFAAGQVKRMTLADGSDSARNAKSTRHAVRLLLQLRRLILEGRIQPHLPDNERDICFEIAALSTAEAVAWIETTAEYLRAIESVHPLIARESPDYTTINNLCIQLRKDVARHV